MKINKYLLLSLVFSFIVFAWLPIYVNAASILSDDFNTYSNGSVVGQGEWFNRANGLPYVVQGQEGKKALYNNNTGADSVITKTSSIALPNGEQSFWIRTENRSGWGSYNIGENFQLGLFQGSWDGASRATLAFMKDGHVAILDTVTDKYVNFDTYTDNSWTLVEAEWRILDKTIRWRVNNGVWTNWIPFVGSTSFTGFDTVGFVTFYLGSGGVYIDNLGIASVPPAITPLCTVSSWQCGDWDACTANGSQTRSCNKVSDCEGGVSAPTTSQSCTYIPPNCSSWIYSSWSGCQSNGTKTRTIINSSPDGCTGGNPVLTQSCTLPPAYQPPQPTCDADIWTCGEWNICSLSGIQNRSCRKTFNCSSVETAPPTTDQYCEAPNRPTQQVPQGGGDEISNQEAIIKSTVKLLCPVDSQRASQGSGTIINSNGTILTNKHVIAGTLGCLVGFINDFNDEPYFGERQIADITKVSSNQDIAILKIRNPQNKNLTSVDITKGNNNLRLGSKVTIYGYPAKFGTKVTYTSGDFSGTDGSYIKTTAILEYGNSGGGSYLKDGTFIGIPSAVVRGELNALGYILSINTINSWLGNSSTAYGGTNNNNYSRVSVLENMDLKKLGSLKLFIPDTDAKGNLATPTTSQNTQKITEQPKINQTQKESTVIEPSNTNQNNQNPTPPVAQPQPKNSWIKRFFQWFASLF